MLWLMQRVVTVGGTEKKGIWDCCITLKNREDGTWLREKLYSLFILLIKIPFFNFKSPPLIIFLPHVLYVNPKWTKWSIPRLVGIRDWNHYEMGRVHGSGVIWLILFGQIHLKSTKNCQITILFGDWIETDGSDYL